MTKNTFATKIVEEIRTKFTLTDDVAEDLVKRLKTSSKDLLDRVLAQIKPEEK